MPDNSQPGGLPPLPTGGPGAGGGNTPVIAPNTVHLPPITGIPPGPATTQQSRPFAAASTLLTANEAADIITQQTSLISAAGKYVPVSYGYNRWSGYVYFWGTHPSTGTLVIGLLLCEGEIDGVIAVEINNLPMRAGCTYTAYAGTAGQAVDPTIIALTAAQVPAVTYADALPGLAHVVVSIPAGTYAVGELRGVDVAYRGKKVHDPRASGQSAATPSTWTYSTNAALVLADFISSGYAIARGVLPRYGRRCVMDTAGVMATADLDDEFIGNAPNRKKRSEVHLTMLDPTANETWEQALRTHAMCYVDRLGDTVELIPDVARSPAASLDGNQIIKYEKVSEREVGAAPTMMDITFTDTSVKPWRERTVRLYDPRVLTGEIPEIPGQVSLKFCQSYTQAQALGRRRLNTTALSVRSWGISLGAEGYARQKAETLSVTHPLGMTNKIWAIDTATDRGFGEVHLKLSEYDPGQFSDVVQTTPATLGSGVANCASVPNITGLTATVQSVNEDQGGGTYACIRRGKVSWADAGFPCLAYYEVELSLASTVIETANVGTNGWTSSPLSAGSYTVRVRCVSGLPGQAPGAWASTTFTVPSLAACPPVPTQQIRIWGTNQRRQAQDAFNLFYFWNEFTRTIVCDAPLTTVTRTELWFGWGVTATFAGASKVRDDAGAQTQWVFQRGLTIISGFTKEYCTVALGLSASIPASGTFNAPGSAPAGTYTDALSLYTGTAGEWWPPDKVWVRFNNAGVFSDPVEVALSQTRKTYPDTPFTDQIGYMFDGSVKVLAGTMFSATIGTDLYAMYPTLNTVPGASVTYNYISSNQHKVQGQLYDGYGDLITGYLPWQLWKI